MKKETLLNKELPSKMEAKSLGIPCFALQKNNAILSNKKSIAVFKAMVETPATLYAESLPYK